jgi:hypothetical protein
MAGRGTEESVALVEFVGAAGVGKSFLSAKVHAVLEQRNVPVADLESTRIKTFDVRTASTLLHAAALAASIRPKSLHAYARAARGIAKVQLRWDMCRQRPGIYLCDEGLIHRLRGFSRASDRLGMTEIADRLVRHVVVGHVVVVVEASVDKILSRRTARHQPGDEFSRESVAADVDLLQQSIATIVHLQRSTGYGIRMIRVDGENGDFDRLAEEIADAAQIAMLDVVKA